ncbi:MAG: fibronectin type III domain-containing protein, partial [Clostridiales bacterium]|nr:fibronectin type III domain-containing protein [Clostridiales bacterium]
YNSVVTAPTCTAGGYTTYTCTVCGDSYVADETDITAHTYESVVTAPTCTAGGYTTYTCTMCGDSYTANSTAATGHSYEFTKYKVKATVSQAGTRLYTCANCKATKETSYAKVDSMSLSTTVYTYDGSAKTPTITVKDAAGNTISSKWYCVQYYSYKTADSVSEMKVVGDYYVKITFRTKYAGSLKQDVTINPQGTSIVSLSSDSKSFTVTVKEQTEQTTGYQVQYSTSKSFTNATIKSITSNTATTKRVSGLTAGTYYVRVRTYTKLKVNGKYVKFYSDWSTGKKVKVAAPSVTLSKTTYTYNGKAKTPSVTVTDANGNTISSKYYTVTYISRATGKTVSSMKSVGKYYVKVKLTGNYSGTVKKAVTIKPKATSISALTTASKGFTVKWGKVTSCTTGYQIQYSTDKSFSSKTTKTVKDNTQTSKTITGLKANQKYYVRIRTYKTVTVDGSTTKIYSSWSSVTAVTTK